MPHQNQYVPSRSSQRPNCSDNYLLKGEYHKVQKIKITGKYSLQHIVSARIFQKLKVEKINSALYKMWFKFTVSGLYIVEFFVCPRFYQNYGTSGHFGATRVLENHYKMISVLQVFYRACRKSQMFSIPVNKWFELFEKKIQSESNKTIIYISECMQCAADDAQSIEFDWILRVNNHHSNIFMNSWREIVPICIVGRTSKTGNSVGCQSCIVTKESRPKQSAKNAAHIKQCHYRLKMVNGLWME